MIKFNMSRGFTHIYIYIYIYIPYSSTETPRGIILGKDLYLGVAFEGMLAQKFTSNILAYFEHILGIVAIFY